MMFTNEANYTMYRSVNVRNSFKFWMLPLLVCMVMAPELQAQMFSVQPERDVVSAPPLAITYGFAFTDFIYRGPAAGAGQVNDYSFSEPLSRIQIELDGFRAHALYGRALGANQNVYSQFGAEIRNGILLVPGRQLQLILPVRLSTDYVVIRNSRLTNTNDEFRQNTVGAHSGLDLRVRLGPKARFTTAAGIGYAFSVTGFGLSGGSATDWSVSNRLFFDRLVNDYGLAIGFDLNNRRYNLDDPVFNYLVTQQVIVVGITF